MESVALTAPSTVRVRVTWLGYTLSLFVLHTVPLLWRVYTGTVYTHTLKRVYDYSRIFFERAIWFLL